MKLGEPCWKQENVEKAISRIAQLDKARAHYFLASHSPIRFILDERLETNLKEEDFFQALFINPKREELALIKGEPGAGKSHLIYWLKLRCQNALETGEIENIVPVIIQRRGGSLKDALEQLIQQLPQSFTQYLNPVQEALGRISEATAREKLADALRHELGEAWQTRKRDPLPHLLKELKEICAVTSCRQWLCREGGVIDRNIKRLIEKSEIEERERLPAFSPEEFNITDPRYTVQLTPALVALIDDLTELRDLREKAAAAFNIALPDSIKEMTGLSGTTLRGIFDKIRMDLKGLGKTLALFVEDVSVMTALDEEVVNAVEPQGRDDLCPMIAVLGITEAGVSRLAENQKQRVTSFVSVSGYATEQWRADKKEVAHFAARYLNSIRLDEGVVKKIARDRKTGGDISISKCSECPVQTDCHQCFGKVEIDGVAIGMFPLSHDAPQRLLDHLDEQKQGVRRNPRGLLMHVLYKVLSSTECLEQGRFPEDNMAVNLPPLLYWRGFQEKYCGGWESRDVSRLERLTKGWISAETEEEAATLLKPFLAPLQFAEFSRSVQDKIISTKRSNDLLKPLPSGQGPTEILPPRDLVRTLQSLDLWLKGEELNYDLEPRRLLAKLIREGIPWDDDRSVPLSEWKRLVGGGVESYRFILIEGMRTKVSGTFIIEFKRTKETHDLISALAKFKYLGSDSWGFQGAETDKRIVSTWLRKHTDETIARLHPPKEVSTETSVASAVQFFAFSSVLRRHAKLPQDLVELVEEILADTWHEPPIAFDKEWNALIKDMQVRHRERREFLLDELSVPQGRTGSINFIDPLPIIQHATRFESAFKIMPIGSEYLQDFWQSRYVSLSRMEPYAELAKCLKGELNEWREKVTQLLHILSLSGYETDRSKEALTQYCEDLLSVVEALKETKLRPPDAIFDEMVKSRMFSERRSVWGNAVEKARNLTDDGTTEQLLLYDPKPLAEALQALTYAENYIKKVSGQIELQLAHIVGEGDPDMLTQDFILELQGIISLGEKVVGEQIGK